MKRGVPEETEPAQLAPPQIAFAAFARAVTRRHVIPPVILSLAAASALVAGLPLLVADAGGETDTAVVTLSERFLGNGFSRTIVILFVSAVIYGVLQLAGIAVDRGRMHTLGVGRAESGASWVAVIAGRSLRPIDYPAGMWENDVEGDPHDMADRFSLQRQRYVELGLLPLRFSVWVLPLLGFIGTVVGIARSIVGLETVIAPESVGQSSEGLRTVLEGLQFAFDTTLLGLAAVIPVMLLQMIVGGRENEVTEDGHYRVLWLLTRKGGTGSSEDGLEIEVSSHAQATRPSGTPEG